MIRFFKKKKRESSRVNAFYKKIRELTEKRQRKWADYMNKKFENVSPFRIKLSLVLFSLFFGSACLLIGVRSLSKKTESTTVQKISMPSHILLQDQYPYDSSMRRATLSVDEVDRIKQFRKYLDSLLAAPSGRTVYDSLMLQRPGLLDSLQTIEKVFDNQFKTK